MKINQTKTMPSFSGYSNPRNWSKVVGRKRVYELEKLALRYE